MSDGDGFWVFATVALKEGVSLLRSWFQGKKKNDFPEPDIPFPNEIDVDYKAIRSLPYKEQSAILTDAITGLGKIEDALPPISDRLSAVPHLIVSHTALDYMLVKQRFEIEDLKRRLQSLEDRIPKD